MFLRLRRAVAALLLTLGLGGSLVAVSAGQASATTKNLLGVNTTILAGCTNNDCWTWLLANGAAMRGPTSQLQAQYGYVLVVCSQKAGGFWRISQLGPWGPYNNDGAWHPYCVNPADANGKRWNQYN